MSPARIPPLPVVRAVDVIRHRVGQLYRRLAPAPVAMMEMITNAWAAQAITAAADLGIADALANGPLTAEELGAAVGAEADTVSRLLRALISRDIFRQRRDGRYELNSLADTLRSDAEVSVAGFARFVGSPEHREHWSHLTGAVRTGRAVIPELRGMPAFEYLLGDPRLAEIFNNAMTSASELAITAVTAGYDFSRYPTIVDVGGGHGRLLTAILEATPKSLGILFDLPEVVAGATRTDRLQIAEGSFFESVPPGGDAYVLKSIIHDWPDEDAVRILRNVRDAAGAGKTVLLVEFVIPAHDREFVGKWADLEMLVVAASRERTADEYGRILKQAGFELTRVVGTASPFSLVEARAV